MHDWGYKRSISSETMGGSSPRSWLSTWTSLEAAVPATTSKESRLKRYSWEKIGKLSGTIKEMGNPFQKETRDLLRQDANDIAHPAAAEMTGTNLERGRTQLQEFMKGL